MRLGLLLTTLAFALGVSVIGVRAAPLGASDALGASEALLGQAAYEICKPLDDARTVSVCRPLDDDDDVDEADNDGDDE